MRDGDSHVLERGPARSATGKRLGRRAAARSRSQVHAEPGLPHDVEPNSLLVRLFASAEPDFAKSFTNEQIAGLNAALVNADTRFHAVDFRTSISFFGVPFYITLLMGRERRSRERLAQEGQTQVHKIAIAHIVLALVMGLSCLAAIACLLYLLKSAVGIDLFDGHFAMHDLFFE